MISYRMSYYPIVGPEVVEQYDDVETALDVANTTHQQVKVPVFVKKTDNGYIIEHVRTYNDFTNFGRVKSDQ